MPLDKADTPTHRCLLPSSSFWYQSQPLEMAPFKYEQLATPSSLRLVFLPSTEGLGANEKLELILVQKEMSDVFKRYFALSYVWGTSNKVHTIKVNRQDFLITESLMFFLRRQRKSTPAFWIDAICINQDDMDEKTEQIGRMREIYQSAMRVYADLGPASDDEEVIFKKIEHVSNSIVVEADRTDFEGLKFNEKAKNIRLSSVSMEPYDTRFWEGLGSFLGRPWWTRVWIMQEATALKAANTYLLCGKVELCLSHAFGCAAALHINEHRRPWGQMLRPVTRDGNVARVLRLTTMRKNNELIPLLDVLEHLRGLKATDLRDIVNAALNIANDVKKGEIQISYQASVSDAYRAVAAYYLKDKIAPLRILSYSGTRFQHLEFEPGWESWVPSFYQGYPRNILDTYVTANDGSRRPCYKPFGSENFGAGLYAPSIDGNTLKVSGFFVDTLTALSWPCITLSIQHGIQTVDEWIPSNFSANYFTGETMLDAFLRTVVADISMDHKNPQRGGQAYLDSVSGRLNFQEFERGAEHVFHYSQFRRLAYSVKGYMALVSHQVREGDLLYALFGGSVLYVLRPQENKNFILVGDCYVHGLMDGEAIQLVKEGKADVEMVSII